MQVHGPRSLQRQNYNGREIKLKTFVTPCLPAERLPSPLSPRAPLPGSLSRWSELSAFRMTRSGIREWTPASSRSVYHARRLVGGVVVPLGVN